MAKLNRRIQKTKYIIGDTIIAAFSWFLFFIYRKHIAGIDIKTEFSEYILHDKNLWIGLLFITALWITIYYIIGTYKHIYRKSRLIELGQTIASTFIGVLIIFFILILDDDVTSYKFYYSSFLVLFSIHLLSTAIYRITLTTITVKKIHKGVIGFNTIIVGSNGNAMSIYNKIKKDFPSSGNLFVGFVNVLEYKEYPMSQYINYLGYYTELKQLINKHNIEEVIIALEPSENQTVQNIITELEASNVIIKVIPNMYDILLGSVKMTSLIHAPLIQIAPGILPAWQVWLKRFMDISISVIAIILLIPVYIFIIIAVATTSKGSVFYMQERLGIHGKSFNIIKFRSMYTDAEKNNRPQLSSKNDCRITPFGKFLRKVRLDETPQFFNVLKGDMSLVGPRPERAFYVDQIIKKAPHYKLLHKVKPGITSWGQVKYGYAENIDEMIERLEYDILYIENMSISMDLKILIYTVLTILKGSGK